MQQNVVLAVLKILVIIAFCIFLGLDLFATQNLEEKINRTRQTLDGLSESVAETNRRLDRTAATAESAREASNRTYDQLNALLAGLESGTVRPREGDAAPPSDETKAPAPVPRGEASVIAGKKVWPRNPGWTVLCDKGTNDDPKRDLPVERIDWDAIMPDYISGEPKGLNWYSDDRNVTVTTIARYVTDILAERKTTNLQEWNAVLAERIEESPDRRQYMIYLRKGVRWHRPALDLADYPWLDKSFEVTARDVKYTFDIIVDPNTTSPLKPYFDELEEVEIVDDYTIRVTWERANFYARATTMELRPMPEHIMAYDPQGKRYDDASLGAAFNNHWFLSKNICGNGPYRFAEYRKGESIRIERNENYYGQRATCREIRYRIITDPETRLAKFWNREVFSIGLGAEQYRRVILEKEQPHPVNKYENYVKSAPKDWKSTYFIWRRPVYGGFAWNMRRPVFRDRRVRVAMTYALNRYAVPEKLFYGLGEVIPVGQSVFSPYFPKGLENLPFDLDAAGRLLEEAGWKDGDGDGVREKIVDGKKRDLEFELVIAAASPLQVSITEMYKQDLLKIGVKLNSLPVDSALWGQRNAAFDFDGLIIFWFAGVDSDPRQLYASEYADQPGSNNYPGYKNAEADEIFEKLKTTFDYPTRIKLYRRWYEIQYRDNPYTWIWSVHSAILVDADWRVPEPKLDPPYVDRRLVFRWKDR